MTCRDAFWVTLIVASLASPIALRAQDKKFEVTLKKAWVSAFADRATVTASMLVKHTHTKPNAVGSGGDDGDMHFAGVSDDIGLPFVAEIVNAALTGEKPAEQDMISKQKTKQQLTVVGAWRLWFEHPSKTQTQGDNNAFQPDNTNPNHSFEIHPVSRVDQDDVGSSFVPIKNYQAYPADLAFPYFDGCTVTIKASSSAISIRSKQLKYNYVVFDAELTADPKKVTDGYIALGTILKSGDEEAANGARRLIFIDGTNAAAKIKAASAGDRLRLLGIPRIDLRAVLALVAKNGTRQFDAQLPYEMIVVGVL
jgi:hypothetical protein